MRELPEPCIAIEIMAGGKIPVRGSELAAGYDLTSAVSLNILPGEKKLIGTGIKIAMPAGYEAQIRPRSGLSLKSSLVIANSPGTIDADYRDEVKIIARNDFSFFDLPQVLAGKPELIDYLLDSCTKISYREYLKRSSEDRFPSALWPDFDIWLEADGLPFGSIRIKEGDRIAQIIFARAEKVSFAPSTDISQLGKDRGGGFGSTGLN